MGQSLSLKGQLWKEAERKSLFAVRGREGDGRLDISLPFLFFYPLSFSFFLFITAPSTQWMGWFPSSFGSTCKTFSSFFSFFFFFEKCLEYLNTNLYKFII
jgi:hypothetical protein